MIETNFLCTLATLELSQHKDEVWYLEFSHDGTKLATTGADNNVIIYNTATFVVQHRLTDHGRSVVYATWSPDDSKLITCSLDNKARMWDAEVYITVSRSFLYFC
jgi:WD repeat-containing protein 26